MAAVSVDFAHVYSWGLAGVGCAQWKWLCSRVSRPPPGSSKLPWNTLLMVMTEAQRAGGNAKD